MIIRLLIVLAVIGAGYRAIRLYQSAKLSDAGANLAESRQQLIEKPRGTAYHFDAQAKIVLGVGPDGQPGKAGVNDNADGQLDDAGELGAVGGDDQCLGPSDPEYRIVANDPRSIVISNGGFVAGRGGSETDQLRYLSKRNGWFIVD